MIFQFTPFLDDNYGTSSGKYEENCVFSRTGGTAIKKNDSKSNMDKL